MSKLYQYDDFLQFLADHVADRKAANAAWSYGAWAKRLGLAGAASVTMMLKGQRKPGPKLLEALSRYFQFTPTESAYFYDLANLYCNRSDDALFNYYKNRLAQRRASTSLAKQEISLDQFSVVGKWLSYALREMVSLKDFKPDLEWIRKRLRVPVTEHELQSALENLQAAGLIQVEKGNWRTETVTIQTPLDIQAATIRSYHADALELSRQALKKVSPEEREFQSLNLNIKKEDLPRIKNFLRQFQDDFCAVAESKQGDEVYQLNLQFFPLTESEPHS